MNVVTVTPGIPGEVIKKPPVVPTFDVKLTLEEAIHLRLVLGAACSAINWSTFMGLKDALRLMGISTDASDHSFDDTQLASRSKVAASRYLKEALNG